MLGSLEFRTDSYDTAILDRGAQSVTGLLRGGDWGTGGLGTSATLSDQGLGDWEIAKL